MQKPFPQSYWARDPWLLAGHYPGSLYPAERDVKLAGLLACGIRRVINLIPGHEVGSGGQPFDPYAELLQAMAAQQGVSVECLRLGYADGSTPERSHMSHILDVIDASIAAKEPVYVHCYGGHGRTGTTVGCHLIRHGYTAQEAIAHILTLRAPLPINRHPFEGQQEAFVRTWQVGE
jgi:hypothetical protein